MDIVSVQLDKNTATIETNSVTLTEIGRKLLEFATKAELKTT